MTTLRVNLTMRRSGGRRETTAKASFPWSLICALVVRLNV